MTSQVLSINPVPDSLTLRAGIVGAVAAFSNIPITALHGESIVSSATGVVISSVLAVASTVSEAGTSADVAVADVREQLAVGHMAWSDRWEAAFVPNNTLFSGNLPLVDVVTTPPAIQRTYYLSCVSFLSVYKLVADTHTTTPWSRSYTTGGPRTAITAMYYWDMCYQATLLSLLDPDYVKFYAQCSGFY
jgi:hypothetical protein